MNAFELGYLSGLSKTAATDIPIEDMKAIKNYLSDSALGRYAGYGAAGLGLGGLVGGGIGAFNDSAPSGTLAGMLLGGPLGLATAYIMGKKKKSDALMAAMRNGMLTFGDHGMQIALGDNPRNRVLVEG